MSFKSHPYSRHMLGMYARKIISKDEVMRDVLQEIRKNGYGSFGWCENFIETFRKAGYDWPEFKIIEKSLRHNDNFI